MANFRTAKRKTFQATAVAAVTVFSLAIFIVWGWTNEIPLPETAVSTGEELTRHVRTLASDEMMGRGVDTPGINLARDYIAAEFKKYSLLPGVEGGNYFQRLDVVTGVEVREPSAASLGKNSHLAVNTDWIPLGLSASSAVERDLVFAGYGITAKDYPYDDYAGVDVKGKIVLVLRYEPPPNNSGSPFRKLPQASAYATLQAKIANARDHGAVGLILVDLSPKENQEELIPVRRTMGRGETGVVAVQIRREIVEQRLQAEGLSLAEMKDKIDREEKPSSIAVPSVNVLLNVKLQKITTPTDNVVAVLSGSDPRLKQENIVIGAHYDHLGLGHFGTIDPSEGQIHHGADDNASGTAVLMLVAARLSRMPERPPRSIVFVAFTGEELGLYGSRYFVDHPPFPIASIKAMINLDMVGRMKNNRVTAGSVDSAKEFRDLVARAAQGLDVEMRPGGGRSDHVSFYNKGIPAVHFSTGTHADYHRPSDTWEKLNIQGMAKVSDVVLSLAREIAATKEGLTFVKVPSLQGG